MQDIILVSVSHLYKILIYRSSNPHSVFLCNLISVVSLKFLEECDNSGIKSCKSLGLPRWHEVGMDLIHGCRHQISSGMALLLHQRGGGSQAL